jgi:hypothetical protein
MKKNTEALLVTSKVISLDVNAEKTNVTVCLRSFKNVAKFRYLGKPLTNENCMRGEMTSRLNSGKAVTIWCRIFCPKIQIKLEKLSLCLFFCTDLKLGLPH